MLAAELAIARRMGSMSDVNASRIYGARGGLRRNGSTDDEAVSCAPASPHVLFYPRIEKTGSQTMLELLQLLAVANNFTLMFVPPPEKKPNASAIAWDRLKDPRPSIVTGHIRFPSDEEPALHNNRIAHFSIVREPVARCLSGYYYYRANEPLVRADHPPHTGRVLGPCFTNYGDSANETLDACLSPFAGNAIAPPAAALPACFVSSCGASQQACYVTPPSVGCSQWCALEGVPATLTDEEVLHAAQRSVRDHYRVVGIMEAFEDTVDVLERVFPRFFAGGGAVFRAMSEERKHLNSHTGRPLSLWTPPSPATRATLARIVSPDTAFYEDTHARFRTQHAACRIPSPSAHPQPGMACDANSFLDAWDAPASDLRNTHAENPAACCTTCVADAACAAWVWRDGSCWLKAGGHTLRYAGKEGGRGLFAGYVRTVAQSAA